jgi:hypothetical protein
MAGRTIELLGEGIEGAGEISGRLADKIAGRSRSRALTSAPTEATATPSPPSASSRESEPPGSIETSAPESIAPSGDDQSDPQSLVTELTMPGTYVARTDTTLAYETDLAEPEELATGLIGEETDMLVVDVATGTPYDVTPEDMVPGQDVRTASGANPNETIGDELDTVEPEDLDGSTAEDLDDFGADFGDNNERSTDESGS